MTGIYLPVFWDIVFAVWGVWVWVWVWPGMCAGDGKPVLKQGMDKVGFRNEENDNSRRGGDFRLSNE